MYEGGGEGLTTALYAECRDVEGGGGVEGLFRRPTPTPLALEHLRGPLKGSHIQKPPGTLKPG